MRVLMRGQVQLHELMRMLLQFVLLLLLLLQLMLLLALAKLLQHLAGAELTLLSTPGYPHNATLAAAAATAAAATTTTTAIAAAAAVGVGCSLVGWSLLVDRFPSAVVTCGSALPLARATRRLEGTNPLDRHRPTVCVGRLRQRVVPIAAVGRHLRRQNSTANEQQ